MNALQKCAEGVLDYSSEKEEVLDLEIINLANVAEEAAQDTLRRYQYVSFENNIDPNFSAKADGDHTYRIFQNLIRNAAQALENSPGAKVMVEARNGGNKVYTTLSDNGPG